MKKKNRSGIHLPMSKRGLQDGGTERPYTFEVGMWEGTTAVTHTHTIWKIFRIHNKQDNSFEHMKVCMWCRCIT